MKIELKNPIGMEGIIHVDCHDGKGELIHSQTVPNLIVNNGWASLGDKQLGKDLLNTCIVGRNIRPPGLGDLVLGTPFNGFVTLYQPVCPDDPPGIACAHGPIRSIVGRSSDNGGAADVFDYVDSGGQTYWRLTRKRRFTYSSTYFLSGHPDILSGTCALTSDAWRDDGWTHLDKEAGYIGEVGFCSDIVGIANYVRNCAVVPEWQAGTNHIGRLWNRVVLPTSVGFGDKRNPDVKLPTDGVITVTLELRAHFSKTAQVQTMNINGVSTTVSTRVHNLLDTNYYGNGFLRNFGYWQTGLRAGLITEQNVMPVDADDKFNYNGLQSINVCAERVSTGLHDLVQRYLVLPGDGNWAGGIGSLLHGDFSNDSTQRQVMVTTFSPKIVKTNLEKVDMDIHYTWQEHV